MLSQKHVLSPLDLTLAGSDSIAFGHSIGSLEKHDVLLPMPSIKRIKRWNFDSSIFTYMTYLVPCKYTFAAPCVQLPKPFLLQIIDFS